ncbi:unnamed protein product [Parnassius apollo]|uniref:(apollo) hypothetical protein n=1 Tax=Parnassius apollo TaxID=110799 RepID=A0A8S3X4A8_PARAO|nr:unnamed protein product [Parnassius apollo]
MYTLVPGKDMATQNRPYQGYPYVNPIVIDVPSLDSATAARWANLPRRPIGTPVHKNTERPGISKATDSSDDNKINRDATSSGPSRTNRDREEDNPVVYIDVPESSASSVIESPRDTSERDEETFVQETILYDPIKNRRIELREANENDDYRIPAYGERFEPSPRPAPSSILQIPSPGGSSGYQSTPSRTIPNSNLPAFMSKEAELYGRPLTPDDGFSLTPIPVRDFPEPPPAYTEIDRVTQPNTDHTTPPPRTEVITSGPNPIYHAGSDSKHIRCQHCGQMVHSIVMREAGVFTHILAFIFAISCLIPVVMLIYCTDGCKYKNHYCPNCRQQIGYEIPILCQEMAYVEQRS